MSLYLAVFGKPRYLGLVDIEDEKFQELGLSAGARIVVETLRGVEVALLGGTLSREQEGKYRSACLDEPNDEHTRGPEPMLQEVKLIGPAAARQIQEHEALRKEEEAALVRARQILQGHQFQMKLVDVEYTLDRKKLFFYFTSEQRVDFRAYVRDLAKEFRIRIEMRQIGVRDEAKTVRGVSPCGRPCCCSYWLHRFTPINIRMVKEQNLALNPTKISGICGRLMCCMFYEYAVYDELWKTLPSPGSKIKAPQGNYVLNGVDLRNETVKVGLPEGKEAAIPVAEFAEFKETVLRGEPWKKEEENAARNEHSPAVPRGTVRTPFLSRARLSKAKGAPEDAKSARKLKPEKISIEEHIAERVNHAETDAKKYQRRRKDTFSPGPRRPEESRAPQERRPSPDQRPRRPANAPSQTAQSKDGRAGEHSHGAPSRNYQNRRPRPYKDGGHGHSGHTGAGHTGPKSGEGS